MTDPNRSATPFLFTVDVESDWGTESTRGIREALPRLLESLERRSARATFFVVGELAHELRTVIGTSSAHEVGSHGLTHRVLTTMTEKELDLEIRESKRRLQDCGFDVVGFRAPFLRSPRGLPSNLARAEYRYDSSLGSVLPSPRNLRGSIAPRRVDGITRLQPCTLRDRLTPFSLTALRLALPFRPRPRRGDPTMFYCHLHEFLDDDDGWRGLPGPLRRLHARNVGEPAWEIVDRLLVEHGPATTTCRDYVESIA